MMKFMSRSPPSITCEIWEGGREEGEGGRAEVREERKGGREGGWEGGREGGTEGVREGGRKGEGGSE